MSCCHVDFFRRGKSSEDGCTLIPPYKSSHWTFPFPSPPSLSHYQPVDRTSLSPSEAFVSGCLQPQCTSPTQAASPATTLQSLPSERPIAILMKEHGCTIMWNSGRGEGGISLTKWEKLSKWHELEPCLNNLSSAAIKMSPWAVRDLPQQRVCVFTFCSRFLLLFWCKRSETSFDIWVDTSVSVSGASHAHFGFLIFASVALYLYITLTRRLLTNDYEYCPLL